MAQKYSTAYVGSGATPITGCDMIGHIAVVTAVSFTSWSSASFVGGLSASYDNSGYVIISDSTTAGVIGRTTGNNTTNTINAPAGTQIPDKPTFWVSLTKDGDGFLALVNKLPPTLDNVGYNTPNTTPAGGRPYFDGTAGFDAAAAKTWLNNNGYWTSYP